MPATAWFDRTVAVGTGCWLVFAALAATGRVAVAEPLVATLAVTLATLVVVPLVARLGDLPFRGGGRSLPYRLAAVFALPAGLSAVVSLSLPVGPLAAVFALPWLVVTLLLAGFGLRRALPNLDRPAELALAVALLYLPVAGVALVSVRAGVTYGFGATTMLLTAVHFHYAACALPAFTGLLAREAADSRGLAVLVAAVVVGPGLVGLGIAFSPAFELVAAAGFALVVTGVALTAFATLGARTDLGSVFVRVGALSVVVSMALVAAYLLPRVSSIRLVGFETMLLGHGVLNAVGFALVGLLGWRLVDPGPTAPPLGLPISRLTSRGRVGADFLERRGLVATGDASGMVDGFDVFGTPAFDATRPPALVRAFYERTAAFDLDVEASWDPGFGLGARLYDRVGSRVEQMNFPVADHDSARLRSRIVPVDDAADGREGVRAWVRTYAETGTAIYVACYATHRHDGTPYMNIAFPLPWTNLTSILEVGDAAGRGGGILLSTLGAGDAGVYLRTPLGPLRTPVTETIHVWAADERAAFPDGFEPSGADAYARHEVFLFGRRFLSLDYRIEERAAAGDHTAATESAPTSRP